jgi:hypothetical protein
MRYLPLFLLLFLPALASAQSQSVDINKASFSWAWAQGTGGSVDSFTIKCGPTSGNYNAFSQITDPTARTLPVKNVVGNNNGNYFCVISASNAFGESPNSSEIFFGVGAVPLPPSSFGLTVTK